MTNQLKTLALFGGLSALLVGLGAAFGTTYLYGALLMALVMNVGAYFYSDQIVLRMSGARIVDEHEAPALHAMIRDLAGRAGLPMPKVALIDDPSPNAFATGRSPERGVVAFTTGIIDALTPRELRGVAAHELGHIANRDILLQSVAAVIASGISGVANMLMFLPFLGGSSTDDEEGGGSPFAGLVLALVAPLAATLIQFGISRSREFLADEAGARISGDPQALADALLRLEQRHAVLPAQAAQAATASLYIVNPLAGASVGRWFSTHPSTDERVARLRAMR